MSTLVILLPPRPREGVDGTGGGGFHHVLSVDGVSVAAAGRAEASALPKADTAVVVLAPGDVAWHRLSLPKAPAARLRQALAGLLEEQLLDEPEQVHLALSPGARAGEPTWVAATHKPWLVEQLAALAAAGVEVDCVAPDGVPGDVARGHFFAGADLRPGGDNDLWLSWTDAQGGLSLRTSGGLARALLPRWSAQHPQWTATPAAAAAAEQWLGAPVKVQSEAEHALAAARTGWNLRQFDVALRARGMRAVREGLRQVMAPAGRPLRWGLAALVAVHLVGLNAWAWQQQRVVEARKGAITEVLRSSHPQVRAILDAPAQMQRETELLRAAAGRVGQDDFETLIAVAAAAWPEGRPPAEQLSFEPGRLGVPAAGWSPEQLQQLRQRVEQVGARLDADGGQLAIGRSPRRAGP